MTVKVRDKKFCSMSRIVLYNIAEFLMNVTMRLKLYYNIIERVPWENFSLRYDHLHFRVFGAAYHTEKAL